MKKPDRRKKNEILQHARWDPIIATLDISKVAVDHLRILDDFLAFIEKRQITSIWSLRVSDFLSFDEAYQSANRLRRLKHGMQSVFPDQPAILVLTDAIRRKEAATRMPRTSGPRHRRLEKSIPADELPQIWKDALTDMEAGFDRNGVMAPSLRMIPTYRMKLRQLAFSAQKAGLQAAFSPHALRAYGRDMRARDLSPATLRASFSAVQKCARYVAADQEIIDFLAELLRIYEEKANKAPKKKYQKLQNTGYSPVAIVNQASKLLSEASVLTCPKSRHAQRNTAAALALFSNLPLRLADTRLVFGKNVLWQEGRYHLQAEISKNQEPWSAEFDPRLNVFINALILRGCDKIWLEHMREECLRSSRPLFIRSDGEGVGYNYVSDCWRRVYGTGEHIARTIQHTFLGIELGPAGTDMALATCGQNSSQTQKHYQDDTVAKALRLKGQASLAEIPDIEYLKLFELI
ncbi:hypothetical protein [Ruegeria sp. MALMAid1280]|uniref:hypothetical protein n=1 Tax=Ruegeria sp. MALMAid1280 TaxID=3411634 RepID=UPI003B9F066F